MRILLVLALSWQVSAAVGSAVCARCHPAEAKSYTQTGMAKTSGRTGQGAFREQFGHPNVTPDYTLHSGSATRRLEWFLGSGHIGRSYLFRKAGQLFQSPLSYYTAPAKWDTSPGYESKSYPEWTRLVESACLQCHASQLQPAAAPQPFLEGGVSCERCHGPGDRHAARPSRDNIVNPAALPPPKRDSVCAQCHLTGAARIARAGKERGAFEAGSLLSDSVAVFVWDTPEAAATSATSHFEKLSASRCKQASGDKLWCGTCHSPHAAASSSETYNRKCQSCHETKPCKANAGNGCTGCHMPKSAGESVAHLVFTDHAIPRRPATGLGATQGQGLKEFWTGQADARDTAIAYAVAGAAGAYERLQAAAVAHPQDIAVLAQLAQQHEARGEEAAAAEIYQRILQKDPGHPIAATNWGAYQIRQGRPKEAMALWLRALSRQPSLIGARLNLAVAQYQSGDIPAARKSLETVLDYEPAHPAARQMLDQLPR
ncbi:MAG TPA: tetratricopeptide repeat protein [Bryobacteraceae bacterium]|nr:tetratricopeptide repeat protein [Bryobacteraceae bacterium]